MLPSRHRPALVGILSLVLGALLLAPSPAAGQGWLADRSRAEGPGFKVGDFELHPGIGVEIGWDSNLFYSPPNPTETAFVDTAILRATAHLLFSTRGQQRRLEGEASDSGSGNLPPPIQFRGGVSASLYHFFARNDLTNVDVAASLRLTVLQSRPFSFSIYNDFNRSIRPFTIDVPGIGSQPSWNRIQNVAGLDLNFATTGQVLRITARYRPALDWFEDVRFRTGNRVQHQLTLEESFRFLPQTAIVHETTVVFVDYFAQPDVPANQASDGITVRTRVGLSGAVTNQLTLLGLVGYGAGFFNSPPAISDSFRQDYESLVLQASARWRFDESSNLGFGYIRGFQPSFVGNFYREDRGFVNFQTLIGGTFLLGLNVSGGLYAFGAIVDTDGTPIGDDINREDWRLMTEAFGEYRLTDWLGFNASFRYTGNFSNFDYRVDVIGGPSFLEPANFNKFEIFFGTRVFY